MQNKTLLIAGAICAVTLSAFTLWRNSPNNKVRRFLKQSAAIASVTKETNEISRRVKASRLQNFAGFEIHVDVKGLVEDCDLMQDEAIAAWLYVVGRDRRLAVEMLNIELTEKSDQHFIVNADISIASDFEGGKYSDTYPVTLKLAYIEKTLRVVSLRTRR